jgi:hypothetical protein
MEFLSGTFAPSPSPNFDLGRREVEVVAAADQLQGLVVAMPGPSGMVAMMFRQTMTRLGKRNQRRTISNQLRA